MSTTIPHLMKHDRFRPIYLIALLAAAVVVVTLWFGSNRSTINLSSKMDQPQGDQSQGSPSGRPTSQSNIPSQSVEQNAAPSEATDVRPLTTKQVFNLSSKIILAKCRNVTTRRENSGNIFTFSEFKVISVIKGPAIESVTLRLLGGRIGNAEVSSANIPSFTVEEEVVLFLGRENKDGYPTVFPQGVFRVREDPTSKTKVVHPKPTGLQLFSAQGNKPYSASPDSLPLEDFLVSLRKLK